VPLAAGRESRAVLGYSYGGLAAVRFALARPDDFGRVIAMSPSLWFAHRAALDAFEQSHAPPPLRLYVDAGTREGDEGEVVPYMIEDARALVGLARARGMQFGRDVALREIPRTGHDMAQAAVRLPGALQFALGDARSPSESPVRVSIDVFERVSPRSPTTFSIDAAYASGIVLSWPADLAHARLAGTALEDMRLPAHASGLEVEVEGVRAVWP
jgi:pimeloyl-ACP methyl ester carboxylesterase